MNGSLEDYSPAGALRMLATSGKTGAVRFSGEGGCTVYLHRGQLYFARDERTDEAIVNALVRPGRLTADAWTAAVAEAGQLPQIGELLVSQGAIEDDLLASVVLSVVYDPLIRLFREGDGEFEFEPDVVHWIGPFRTFNVDAIVNEVRRRVRQVDEMAELIPSLDAVVSPASTLPGEATQVTLLREDWEVVVGLDAGQTVTEVAERLGRGRYSAARVVHRLAQAELVTVTVQIPEEAVEEPAVEEPVAAEAAVEVEDSAVAVDDVEVTPTLDAPAPELAPSASPFEREATPFAAEPSIWDDPAQDPAAQDEVPAEADDPFGALRSAVVEEVEEQEPVDPWGPAADLEPAATDEGDIDLDLSRSGDENDPWASLRSDDEGEAGSPWWDDVPMTDEPGDLASRWSEGSLPSEPAPSGDREVSFALPRRVALQEDERRHADGELDSLAAIGGFKSAIETSSQGPSIDDDTQQANAAWLESLYDQFMEADATGDARGKKDAFDVAFHADELSGEEKVGTLRRLMKALKKV